MKLVGKSKLEQGELWYKTALLCMLWVDTWGRPCRSAGGELVNVR